MYLNVLEKGSKIDRFHRIITPACIVVGWASVVYTCYSFNKWFGMSVSCIGMCYSFTISMSAHLELKHKEKELDNKVNALKEVNKKGFDFHPLSIEKDIFSKN